MEVLNALRGILQDNVTVSGLATGGIHINQVDQGSERPNVMIMLVGGSNEHTQQGPMNMEDDRIRVYSRADTARQASELGRTIYNLFNGYAGSKNGVTIDRMFRVMKTGDWDDKAEVHRCIDDYRVINRI